MIPYGLTKKMSSHIHPHNKCETCNSEVDKKKGRSSARMKEREELRKIEVSDKVSNEA